VANPVANPAEIEVKIRQLEAAIGRVTAAIAKASDDDIVELVAERREMRVELQALRDAAAPSNVVRLPGRRGGRR
jgi:HJR/Mrr/RecB family endonuclease